MTPALVNLPMRMRCRAAGVALLLLGALPLAHASSNCDALLRPDAAQIDADYGALQAYLALNAAAEYDRLDKLDPDARVADAAYRVFSTEFDGSRSPEEFRQRVRARLRGEGYALGAPELRGEARMHVSEQQMSDWTACAAAARSGALLVVAAPPEQATIPLKLSYAAPAAVPKAELIIAIVGGAVDGNGTLHETVDGKALRTYAITPDKGSERLIVSVNVAGLSDRLIIDRGADAPVASITACDEPVAVEASSGGLVPAGAAKGAKPWAYGCKEARRVVVPLPSPGVAATAVSVCDAPVDVTYRRQSGIGYLLTPASKPGAAVMQACRVISERKVAAATAACTHQVPALVCNGARPISIVGDVLAPAGKGKAPPYAYLCERATTQPVCAGG